jgi:ribose 5-phosphate isomerase A
MWELTAADIQELGGQTVLRHGGGVPYRTDNGNLILDTTFGPIVDPGSLDQRLNMVPGVMAHGLFVGMATAAVFAGPHGVRVLGVL